MHLVELLSSRDFSGCMVLLLVASTLVLAFYGPAHASTFLVTTTADTGAGSFRRVIIQANANVGRDTVYFAIPGPGPHTIQPQSSFDVIADQLLIDGYSQPGATLATDFDPAVLLIEVDGGHINDATFGVLRVCADSCLIRGMTINRFVESGIQIVPNGGTARGNVIEGCYLGTDIEGTRDLGNGFAGMEIYGADSNVVGGVESSSRNIISGNMWGVFIWDGHHNVVIGNLIGTDAFGAADLGNTYSGVSLSIAWENTIGGAIAGSRNIISGNDWRGISVYDSDNNLIEGNYVGTDITGQLCIENGSAGIALSSSSGNTIGGLSENSKNVISCSDFGIRIEGGNHNVILGNSIGTGALGIRALGNSGSGVGIITSAYNTIGGSEDGAANIIAYNGGAGICVDAGGPNIFLSNAIYSNNLLGIDIGNDGVTPNDPSDNVQDYPVLMTVISFAGGTTIQGTLHSEPSTEYHLEFFSNAEPDPSTYGEGEAFLGFASVSTDAVGEAEFVVSLPVLVAGGMYVSATATDLEDATSEFSKVVFVMTLAGDIVADELALRWTPVPGVAQYWMYGATNDAYFEPGLSSPYENRLAILPSGTTAWGTPYGIGDPYSNWTYLVLAVDGSSQEISRTNRFGEFEFFTPIP